jgi:hypothetical protein
MNANPKIDDPRLQRLYDYWCIKRGARTAPMRCDMRPEDIPSLLPFIYIIEVFDWRFRFRLAGSNVVAEYGAELTGKYLDEIDLDGAETPIIAEYRRVVFSRQPAASRWRIKLGGREISYEHLLLPLSNDGRTVDMLFNAAAMCGRGPETKPPRFFGMCAWAPVEHA